MKVVLIGFMGSGKSTVGAALAKKLGYDFIEMDQLLVQQSGYDSIPQIFAEKGEAYFRDQETALANALSERTTVVISTGGGTPCRAENMTALKRNEALTVHLAVNFETAQLRVGNDTTRPLWRNIGDTRTLFEHRILIYKTVADVVIDGSKDQNLVVAEIQHILGQRSAS